MVQESKESGSVPEGGGWYTKDCKVLEVEAMKLHYSQTGAHRTVRSSLQPAGTNFSKGVSHF